MAKYKVAAIFEIIKWDGEDLKDYTLEDFTLIHSHPSLENVFLFHEDLLDVFPELEIWEEITPQHVYRIFIVIAIEPNYSTNYEYGISELDHAGS